MFPFLWLGLGFAIKWWKEQNMFDFFLVLLSFALIITVLYMHAAWWMAILVFATWLLVMAIIKVE